MIEVRTAPAGLHIAIQTDGRSTVAELGASQAIQLGERLVRLGLRALFREEAAGAPLAPPGIRALQ